MKETTKVPPSQDYALDSTAEQASEKGDGDGKECQPPDNYVENLLRHAHIVSTYLYVDAWMALTTTSSVTPISAMAPAMKPTKIA